MSYRTWTTYGYGFCVDDIETTPEKLLQLASTKPDVIEIIREYLDAEFQDGYTDEKLTISDFDALEGEYAERGVAYVLYNVIDEIQIDYADDFNGFSYILYAPTYPWYLKNDEKDLSEDDVKEIFSKYIRKLTDKPITIDYYSVENGG